jgi:hypothetical protein
MTFNGADLAKLTEEQIHALFEAHTTRCCSCGKPITDEEDCHPVGPEACSGNYSTGSQEEDKARPYRQGSK